MLRFVTVSLLVAAALAACTPAPEPDAPVRRPRGDEGEGDGGEGEGEGEGGEGEGETPSPPPGCQGAGCPRILSLSSNVTTMSDDTELVVSAIVTDADGIDDVIGGTLFDPTSTGTYGTFQTSAAEGAYELRLSWNALNTVRPIDFDTSGSRVLRARFFDQAGNETFADLTLTLTCGGRAACNGSCGELRCGVVCVDDALIDDDHCGACNAACPGEQHCTNSDPRTFEAIEPTCLCTTNGELDQCAETCVDLGDDRDNCGVCGFSCGANAFCEVGTCSCFPVDSACAGPHGDGSCVRVEVGSNTVADLCMTMGGGRLVDGANAREGFLEVEINGSFMQVCSDDFGNNEALATAWCAALGRSGGTVSFRDRSDVDGFTMRCSSGTASDCVIGEMRTFTTCPVFDDPVYLVCN